MDPVIFCSHHRPLTQRKIDIIKSFEKFGLEIRFIEDFEFGRDIEENPTKLRNAQYSVMLKHFKMLDIMVEENLEYAFLIEDDLLIPDDFDLRGFFDSIISQRGNCNIIFFGTCCNLHVPNPIEGTVVYPGPKTSRCGHGYFVNQEFAKKVSQNKRFTKTYDHLLMEYIQEYNFNSAWTHPSLLQKTETGMMPTSLG